MTGNSGSGRERLWNRYYICVFLATICFQNSQNILNNDTALYAESIFGGATIGGLLTASFAVFCITARFIGGYFTDHLGRRIVAVIGCLIFGIAALMMGLFPVFALLVLFRGLTGFGFSLANTSMMAVALDTAPKSRMSEGISFFWLAQALSYASAGTLSISLIINGSNFLPVFVGAAVFLGVSALLLWLCSYEKQPGYVADSADDDAGFEVYHGIHKFVEKKALPAGVIEFFMCFAVATITTFLYMLAADRGFENPSLFFTFTAVFMFLGTFFCSRLTDKFGYLPILIVGLAFGTLGLLAVGLTNSLAAFYFCGAAYGLMMGFCHPCLNALAVKHVPVNRRGAASSTYMLAIDIACGVGGVVWGLFIDALGYSFVYTAASLFMLAGMVLSIVFFRGEVVRKIK